MRVEFVSMATNVVRFPVERRAKPTLALLSDIAPDGREVELVAEAFGFDPPDGDLRDRTDRATAERLAGMTLPAGRTERRAVLAGMLNPVVVRAVAACGAAHEAARRSDEAAGKLADAQIEGGYWLTPLEDATTARAEAAAHLLIAAYEAAQEAYGAARAIGLAERGEVWVPFDVHAEADALFGRAAG